MELSKFEKQIGVEFKNKNLLKEAVTHRSYLNENTKWDTDNNERLEFLGDAVLELVVTENLFKLFPDKEEGELTVYRSALVNYKLLSEVAKSMGLDDQILMSKGEARESLKTRGRETILANAIESVIGAIYLDQGYDAARKMIDEFVMPHLKEITKLGGKDAKSRVQEITQSTLKITPTYKVIDESGPAHQKTFRVGLFLGKEKRAEGLGPSKQEAELNAAEQWLKENIKR